MEQIAIDVAGLEKSYDRKPVLRGVDLRVPRGTVVGLMGMNGSGKSTLIKCLLGLVRADAGSSRLLGSDSRNLSPEVKGRLGYVPQVVHQLDWMKVRHLIQYTSTFYPTWDDDWVAELVERWRVPLDQRVQALSTGQLQTLAIVLALVLRWRVGNPRIRTVLLILLGTLGMAAFLLIPLPVVSLVGRQTPLPLRLGVYPTFMLFIACCQIAAIWRKRITCLDVESLRPVCRTTLQREWGGLARFGPDSARSHNGGYCDPLLSTSR